MIFDNKTVGLVTRCRNRVELLRQALPTWTALQDVDKLVIVDWSNDSPIANISSDPRVRIVRKDGEHYFNYAASWNFGLKEVADCDYILLIDCDVKIKENIFPLIDPGQPNLYYVYFAASMGLFGTCIISKEQLQKTGGYTEYGGSMRGEDKIFYDKLNRAGFKRKFTFTNEYIEHIHHKR